MAQGPKPQGRFYLGAFIMPVSTGQPVYKGSKGFPFSTGIWMNYRLQKHLSLSSGFSLLINTRSYFFSSTAYTEKNKSQILTLQVPLRMDYRLGEKDVALLLTGGFVTDIYMHYSYNGSTVEPGRQIRERKTIAWHQFPVHPWLQLGVGLDLNLKRVKIQAFPLYMATLTDWDAHSARIRQGGFMVSALYRI